MARRDLLDLKVMGFNMIRFIWAAQSVANSTSATRSA